MHVLIIPNSYPDDQDFLKGIFVEQQATALSKRVKVGVLNIELKKLTSFPAYIPPERIISVRKEIPVFKKTSLNYTPFLHWFYKFITPVYAVKLYEEYEQQYGKPDIIHAHFSLWSGFAALNLKKKFNVPYIVTEHSSYFAEKKYSRSELKIAEKVFNNAERVICVSSSLKNEIQKNVNVPDEKFSIIPNMIDTEHFKPLNAIKKRKQIISVGTLIKTKGFESLIKGFSKFSSSFPDYTLLIVGGGPEKNNLENLAESLGLKDKVIFAGPLNHQDLVVSYNQSDFFALTSHFETFGIVYAEALSCGLPVLATRCGGPEEIIDNQTGVLCEIDNIEEISEGMSLIAKRLVSDDSFPDYERIRNNFNNETIISMLVNEYKKFN
jgi:L-malate glycosyltransferase